LVLGVLIVGAAAGLVAVSSHRLLGRCCPEATQSAPVYLASLALVAVAQVVATGLALGYTSRLSTGSILLAHAAVALGSALLRPRTPEAVPFRRMAELARLSLGRWTAVEKALGAGLVCVLAAAAVTGLLGEPLTHDALSYRLSRVAYWLQEGSIRHFPTNEPRQNLMPVNGDLVMVFLTHPFRVGFPLVSLSQALGGALVLLSTWILSGIVGLSRLGRLTAAYLVLGMPNVFVQTMTSQNDLLHAGLVGAGLALLLRGIAGAGLAVPAWLGFALGIGSKGTVFYWAPGLALITLVAVLALRPSARRLAQHGAAAVLLIAVLGAPRYVENQARYGDPFGPPEMYALAHGPASDPLERAWLNLRSYGAQALEPASNPAGISGLLQRPWRWLVESLPESDPHTVAAYPRKKNLRFYADQPSRNADVVSSGALAPFLAGLGGALAVTRLRRRESRRDAALVLSLAASALLFALSFSAAFVWWPVNFRYFTLIAPPVAVAGASAVAWVARKIGAAAWLVPLGWAAVLIPTLYLGTANSGLRAVGPEPGVFPFYGQHVGQKTMMLDIVPERSVVGVALPFNSVLAGFFRTGRTARIVFLRPQALADHPTAGEALSAFGLFAAVTPPDLFSGREGGTHWGVQASDGGKRPISSMYWRASRFRSVPEPGGP
jgi:hypothetical protein